MGRGLMSECVVCGVDDSRGAREAVRVAANLSERLGRCLLLVHVARVTRSAHARGIPYGHGESQEEEMKAAARVLREITEEYGLDARAESRLRVGDPVERLVEVAEEQRAVMVVVGSRGRGPLKSALLGSVSAGLAAKAPCPVVVVPPRHE
jgi:nucleotide-binding universal stress UspA family protein